MRLRDPSVTPPPATANKLPAWHRHQAKLVTPLFGGGVQAGVIDREQPVRAAAIRGQLRYWWRLLNGDKGFDQEAELWGALATDNDARAGKVWLRISEVSYDPKKIVACAEYTEKEKNDGTYRTTPDMRPGLSTYALFPGRGELTADKRNIKVEPAEIMLPGLRFRLEWRCEDPQREEEVRQALRWWASFGGLGARTRRGLGSLEVEGLEPVSQDEVHDKGGVMLMRTPEASAMEAWKVAVSKLAAFRQKPGVGRNPGHGNTPGRSYWPEADSLRLITGQHADQHEPQHSAALAFPRAFFGLPIQFHFKDSGDPPDITVTPAGYDRLASPLILRAWRSPEGEWHPLALLLPGALKPFNGLELTLTGDNPHLPQTLERQEWWPQGQEAAQEKAQQIRPLQDRGSNALAAFLEYFKEN